MDHARLFFLTLNLVFFVITSVSFYKFNHVTSLFLFIFYLLSLIPILFKSKRSAKCYVIISIQILSILCFSIVTIVFKWIGDDMCYKSAMPAIMFMSSLFLLQASYFYREKEFSEDENNLI